MSTANAHDESSAPVTPVFQVERHEQIVDMAMLDGRVEVSALAAEFGVTTETIRRDLAQLQEQRLVRRVHGGAVPWERWRFEPKLAVRDSHNREEKIRIAQRAIAELPVEGSIIIDSGSTAAHVASQLPPEATLTVVTNSIPVVQALASRATIDVIVVGGSLKQDTLAMVDASGVDQLLEINVDVGFLSSDGLSTDRGFTTPYREEVAIKQAMMRSARRTVMLIDHSKVEKDHLHRIAGVEEVDTIITGAELGDDAFFSLDESGATVVRA